MNARLPRRLAGALLAAAAALLGACAVQEPADEPRTAATPAAGALLTPWLTLTGGWRLPSPAELGPFGHPDAGAIGRAPLARQMFQLPFGVVARDDRVLIADGGRRQVFVFDRARDAMAPLLPFTNAAADHATSMQLMVDGTLWMADPAGGRVVHVGRNGQVLRTLRDDWFAPRPIAVAVPEPPSDVFVADATGSSIVVFNPFGRVLRRFGGTDGNLQSVAAMALGPDGLYVVDRAAQQVVVFGLDGKPRYTIGEDTLTQPRAIAVDRFNRVFVGDDADQSIKIFVGAQPVGSFGGPGSAPGRFARIDALSVDGNLLYAADSANSRVQIMMVAPESLRR